MAPAGRCNWTNGSSAIRPHQLAPLYLLLAPIPSRAVLFYYGMALFDFRAKLPDLHKRER